MPRTFLFETRGGAELGEFQHTSLSWQVQANTAETVDVTIDLNDVVEGSRDWANAGTPWKHSIAVDVGGRWFGGPILPHDLDGDDGSLRVTARGLRFLTTGHRVLPSAALTQSLVTAAGVPDTSLDTSISGFDLGTIGKKLLQQACGWPGWTDIPIEYHADRAGTRERTYPAIERKNLEAALSDLSGVENGPDIRLQLVRTSPDTFGWVYESGSEDQPRLQSATALAWEPAQGSGLRITKDPTQMGSVSWSEGGRADDTTLVEMLYDPYLVDRGFPLLHLDSDASTNTVDPEVLRAWNGETLRTARRPWEFWSFRVRTDRSPFPYEYNVGDLIDVVIGTDRDVPGGYIPKGTYQRRIAGMSGDEEAEWITITCGEAY
ncbi:hypothetical protein ACIGCK_04750 [Microbacterium sp. NPDC078428]|uniref:hypothetical protein n=1 Tax=Microbacterium sp. NPDC078428 TaxID=3364190 RepID=UPI0037CA0119